MVTFNPMSPEFLESPFAMYAAGRAMGPIYIETVNLWLVFRYDQIAAILRDQAHWSSAPSALDTPAETAAPLSRQPVDDGDNSMLFSDPPRHTRLRSLVNQAFTPRMVERMEPRLRAVAEELLDAIAANAEADIVEALSYPLPVIAIAEILGVPPSDRANFKRWSDAAVATLGGTASAEPPAQIEQSVVDEMREYFSRMVDLRRAQPREDLISALVAAELQGDKLNFEEMLGTLFLLLVAGNETTTNLIGNTILEFMAHPDQLQRVLDDGALLPSAIEEVLRFASPVQATSRLALADTEVGGKPIKSGQRVVLFIAAANRDPDVFPNPDTFDVGRTPNRHLSFGLGIHFCLGAPLARLEAKIALEAFLRRCHNFQRLDNEPLPRVPTFIMRGVRSLPITFSPN